MGAVRSARVGSAADACGARLALNLEPLGHSAPLGLRHRVLDARDDTRLRSRTPTTSPAETRNEGMSTLRPLTVK